MASSDAGRVIDVNALHPLKADAPIVVMASGNSISVSPVQSSNAEGPMAVKVSGTREVLQPINRVLLAVSITALQWSRESSQGLPGDTLSRTRLVQPSKSLGTIVLSEAPISTSSSDSHWAKAFSPSTVTESGIAITRSILQL